MSLKTGWVVEPGAFTVHASSQSRYLPLRQSITLSVPALPVDLDEGSTLREWVDHPVGQGVLQRATAAFSDGAGGLIAEESLPLVVTENSHGRPPRADRLRHTWWTHHLAAGVPLKDLQRAGGVEKLQQLHLLPEHVQLRDDADYRRIFRSEGQR